MKLQRTLAKLSIAASLLLSTASLHAAGADDARIESAAKKSYTFKTYLKDDSISVKSTDGVVVLTGTVNQDYDKNLAEDTVAELPGVRRVDNRLEVRGERPKPMSDAWVAAKVKSALLFHRHVSAVKTEVNVKDGVVTLQGTAPNQAQKDLTSEYAKDVEGVKEVNNLIVVTKSPETSDSMSGESFRDQVDDASITAQVKIALLSHRSTSALATKVKTVDGIVTVSGRAKNEAEKSLVTKLVTDISGVRRVVNVMTVEGASAPTPNPFPSPAQ